MSDQPFALVRPVRAASLAFAGLMTFFAVCVLLFAEYEPENLNTDLEWVKFTLFVPGYCLFLAFASIGLVLARSSRLEILWWRLSLFLTIFLLGGVSLAIWLRWELLFWPGVPHALLAATFAWLFAGCVVAGSGWVRYFRWRRSSAKV